METRKYQIVLIGCASVGMLHALRKAQDDIVFAKLDEIKTEPTEFVKASPIDIFTPLPDVITNPTKPIDAIASRHKYPRKKNQW